MVRKALFIRSFKQNSLFLKTMKKCPNCNQTFATDEVFCVECGSQLITHFDGTQSFSGFSVSLEQPTQVVQRLVQPQAFPPPPNASSPADGSKWLYLVIGGLIAVILTMAAGFFLLRDTIPKEIANANRTEEKSNNENKPSSSNQNAKKTNEMVNVPVNKPQKMVNVPNKPQKMDNTFPGESNTRKSDTSLTRNFTWTYSGTADNDGISMQLRRSGSSLNGKVFSRRSVTNISVSGSISDDGTMSGTWTKPDGSKSRRFFLRSN